MVTGKFSSNAARNQQISIINHGWAILIHYKCPYCNESEIEDI